MVQPNPHNIYTVNVPPRPAKRKPDETYEEYDGRRADAYFRRLAAWEEYCDIRGWKTESEYIFPDGSLYCTVQAPLEELRQLKAVTSIHEEDCILSEDEIEHITEWRSRQLVERAFRLYLRGFDLPMFKFMDEGIEPKLIALTDKLGLPFETDGSKWLSYSLSRDGDTIKYMCRRVIVQGVQEMIAVFLGRGIRCFFDDEIGLDVNADPSEEDINRIQQMLSLEAVEGT